MGKFLGGLFGFALLITVIALFMSSTTVGARSVGIETRFGKYVSTQESGHHWLNPFSSVEEFSTQIQPLDRKVNVSFDGGSSGEVHLTVRWAISKTDGAEDLWKDWKTFDGVRDNLVVPETREATGTAFSAYTPENAIDGANRPAVQKAISDQLTERLAGRGITIDSVSITGVSLNASAQKALDRIVEANANIERARAEQERATIEAQTAKIRAQSQTPESLQRYCLEVLNAWDVSKNGQPPATLNCGLGAGGAQVLVGAN